jgi:hypothetical protein
MFESGGTHAFRYALFNHLVQPYECSAQNEQDIGCIDMVHVCLCWKVGWDYDRTRKIWHTCGNIWRALPSPWVGVEILRGDIHRSTPFCLNAHHWAFHHPQKSLLDALSADIPGTFGSGTWSPCNFVDFVDVNDTCTVTQTLQLRGRSRLWERIT